MQEKYLPLGTVVLLKEGQKRLMIIGFAITASSNGNSYDYLGCLYPEGVISNDKNLVFNHDQIARIDFMGFDSDENKEFQTKLKEVMANGGGSTAPTPAAPADNNMF